MSDNGCVDCPEHFEGTASEIRAWDGPAAMAKCSASDSPASCFRAICAARVSANPADAQSGWALPHHDTAGGPANPGGVSSALGRLNQTQGIDRAAARRHLERHQGEASRPTDDIEIRVANVGDWEIRHSGRKDEAFTVRGYPAVYNALSHDLGGFREKIDHGAFDEVLATDPDVHFLWDHDTKYVGARTRNGTLSLRSDDNGLFIDAQVGNYSWAKDLRTALERGDISQGSFAFNVGEGGDEWDVDEESEKVTRTIRNVAGLYDVTVTAQGAYPQTSLAAVRSLAAVVGRPVPPEATLVAEKGEPESQKGSEEVGEPDPRQVALRTRASMRRTQVADLKERLEKLHG